MRKILPVTTLGFVLLLATGCAATQKRMGLDRPVSDDVISSEPKRPGFWHQTFGQPSGDDPIARDIERRLGIGAF